ncbi:hypothetical protein [Mycobacterium sp. NPDC004974]
MSFQVNFLSIDPREAMPEGFPDSGPHSGAEWMKFAQAIYPEIFKIIEDGDWPKNPVGQLAIYWNAPTGQSAARLINLAFSLNQLLVRVGPEGRQVLKPKIAALFRAKEMVFEENLAELEVGSVLSCNFERFSLEPLVPPALRAAPRKPPSPDYGIEVPEGLVLIDATVWHWENLSAWHRMRMVINERIFNEIDKRKVSRDVLLHLPIKPSNDAQQIVASKQICSKIADSETGEEVIEVGASRPARIVWTEFELPSDLGWNPAKIPRFTEAPIDPALVAHSHPYVIAGTRFTGEYLHFMAELCLTEEDVQNGLSSLRDALDRKKRQASARPDLPYLVAVHLYSGSAKWDEFAPMIEARIWPNPRYRWLSGILAYEPQAARLSSSPSSGPRCLFPIANPNATVPIPASMLGPNEPPPGPDLD